MNESCCSSWLTHGSSNVTVRYPSKKYFVVYEPTGRSPGSVPPSMHLGTQPRIFACWLACCCSPPPPQELSARATRAINTPVANSALSLLMTIPLTPLLSLGNVDASLRTAALLYRRSPWSPAGDYSSIVRTISECDGAALRSTLGMLGGAACAATNSVSATRSTHTTVASAKNSLSVGDRILQSSLPPVFGPRSVCTENPKGGGVPSSWDPGPILLGKSCRG